MQTRQKVREKMTKVIEVKVCVPKDATNGDMIKAMFPNYKVQISAGAVCMYYSHAEDYCGSWIKFDLDWWNAPFKTGSEEKE